MDFRFAISITNSTVSPSFFSPFFLFSVSACERDSTNRIRPGNRDDMTSAFCTDAPATASKRNKLEPVCPSKLLSRTWSSGLVRRQQLQLAFFFCPLHIVLKGENVARYATCCPWQNANASVRFILLNIYIFFLKLQGQAIDCEKYN